MAPASLLHWGATFVVDCGVCVLATFLVKVDIFVLGIFLSGFDPGRKWNCLPLGVILLLILCRVLGGLFALRWLFGG